MKSPEADVRSVLAHHDALLSTLTKRMDGFDSTLKDTNHKLDKVLQALYEQKATVAATPEFSWGDSLTRLRDIAILAGMAVSCIVYVAGNNASADMAVIKHRLTSVEAAVSAIGK